MRQLVTGLHCLSAFTVSLTEWDGPDPGRRALCLHCLSAFTVSLTPPKSQDKSRKANGLHCLSAFTVSLTERKEEDDPIRSRDVSIAFRRSPFH